jgi:glycosyltransferase involved in cell wall biosynthesis
MKISIITISFNSAATIRTTIESVLSQTYSDIEYIVIDGKSKDKTVEILQSYDDRIKWISEPDKGIYDAMSKGVALATGEVVGIINSDDYYPDNETLSRVAQAFAKSSDIGAVYGDLQYVDFSDGNKTIRNWKSGEYNRDKFLKGWMPPHPTFFLKKTIYEKHGLYDATFKSAGDYELMLRMLYRHHIKATYIPYVQMKMRVGGVSNVSLKNRIRANQEDRRAWRINDLKPKWYTLYAKPLSKIFQWLKK